MESDDDDGSVDDPYSVLGVDSRCSARELRSAYLKAALASHPDKNPDDAGAAARFRAVRRAWLLLSDEARRRAHDAVQEAARERKSGRAASRRATPADNARAPQAGEWKRTRRPLWESEEEAAAEEPELWEGSWGDLSQFAEEVYFDDEDAPTFDELLRHRCPPGHDATDAHRATTTS